VRVPRKCAQKARCVRAALRGKGVVLQAGVKEGAFKRCLSGFFFFRHAVLKGGSSVSVKCTGSARRPRAIQSACANACAAARSSVLR